MAQLVSNFITQTDIDNFEDSVLVSGKWRARNCLKIRLEII